MTPEELQKLKLYAELTDTLDKYVILKEDEQGRYIEYAFREGAPHDNRCLSWYNKLQPKALKRNDHDLNKWIIKDVDEIYELFEYSCGKENWEDENERCTAGHPCKRCVDDGYAYDWTYDEPVKCACWGLHKIDIEGIKNSIVMQAFQKTLDKAVKYFAPMAYTHKHLIDLDNFIEYMEE